MESSPVSVVVTSGGAVGVVFVVSSVVVTSGGAVGVVFVVSAAAVTFGGTVGVFVIVGLEEMAIALSSCSPLSEGISSEGTTKVVFGTDSEDVVSSVVY